MDFSFYYFSTNDTYSAQARYRFILDCAKFADQNDFKAIWTPERHFQEFGGAFPNPAVLGAAIAAVTEKIAIRAGSVVCPLHHPARLVEEWSLVDQLSSGRVGLCIAVGWHKADFIFNPTGYSNRREITFQSLQTIQDLWAGKKVGFYGVDNQVVDIITYPRPCQTSLPLWLVHTANPSVWDKAGEMGANVLTLLDNFEKMENNIKRYRQVLSNNGHNPNQGVVTVGLHTFIHDDETIVRNLVEKPLKAYLATFMKQRKHDHELDGSSKAISEKEHEDLLALAFEDMFTTRTLLGSPEKCRRLVDRLAKMGVNEIACLVDFGLSFDQVSEALPNLASLKKHYKSS